MGTLILVRHGMTQYNIDKRFCGHTDVDLADIGREQSRKVGHDLAAQGIQINGVYTSWLKRAWQSIDIILNEMGQSDLEIIKHPFLNERHYGDLQGIHHADMIEKFGEEQVQIWRRSYDVRPPNGESLKDVVYRTQYYLNEMILPRVKNGETILICGHSNSNRSIVKQLENISDEEIVKREIAYDEALIYSI